MFEVLSDKLGNVFKWLGNRGRLSEKDVDQALREVRMALLEGDVNFKVVKDFIARIRERTVGTAVLESLTPGQQVIKIVHEELVRIIGGGQSQLLKADQPPSIMVMEGLQGAGKTTTSAKLALHLRKTGQDFRGMRGSLNVCGQVFPRMVALHVKTALPQLTFTDINDPPIKRDICGPSILSVKR